MAGLGAWTAVVLTLVMPNPANAYIDPATTSYLIQLVSGLVITLSVAIGVFFRRITLSYLSIRARLAAAWVFVTSPRRASALRRAPGEEVAQGAAGVAGSLAPEPDHVIDRARYGRSVAEVEGTARIPVIATGGAARMGTDKSGPQRAPASGRETATRQPDPRDADQASDEARTRWGDWRGYARRAAMAVPVSLAPTFLLFLFGPLDLYLQNAGEFPFSEGDLAKSMVILFVEIAGLTACVLTLLRGRAHRVAVSLLVGLTAAAWAQSAFLNVGYGELDGASARWERYGWLAVVDTAVWLVIVAAPFALLVLSRRAWRVTMWALPTVLVASLGFALVAEQAGAEGASERGTAADEFLGPETPTYDGIFTASSTANQYIIVLDMMDQEFVEEIQAEEPDFFASHLDGFTEFDAHISNYARTLPSAADMLTGARYQFDEPLDQYFARAYRESDFLPRLREAGYSTNIYATDRYSYHSINDIRDLADNVKHAKTEPDTLALTAAMLRLDAFRYMPHLLKPLFWTGSGDFTVNTPQRSFDAEFSNSNFAFYDLLKHEGFTKDGPQPRFSYIHLDGAHPPFTIDRDVNRVAAASDPQTEQARGAFKIAFDFIDGLRETGAYKDATIVITADHGNITVAGDSDPMSEPRLTALFVKPAGAEGTPLAHSTAPTQMENVRALLLEDAGVGLPSDPPTVFEVDQDSVAPRDLFHRRGSGVRGGLIDHWQVTGDARDWTNWHFIDQWPAQYWG
jgi:hypothetical protein